VVIFAEIFTIFFVINRVTTEAGKGRGIFTEIFAILLVVNRVTTEDG
jgi:hypothetical protein